MAVCYRDADFTKYKERGEEMEAMKSGYKQMEIRLHSYEETHRELDDSARYVQSSERVIQPNYDQRLSSANTSAGSALSAGNTQKRGF